MASVTGNAFDFTLFKRVLKYVQPYKVKFYLTALLTIITALMAPIKPFLIGYTIDDFVLTGDKHGLLMLTLINIGVLVIESFLQFFQTYYGNWLGQSVTIDLRSKLYSHVTKFKLKFFDKTPIGTLVTRHISDIDTIGDIFSQGLLVIIGDVLKLVIIIIVMLFIDWKLALLSLLPIPLLLIATNIFKNAIKKAFNQVRNKVSQLNAFAQEHITGMSIVQIFNRENAEMKKFEAINKEHRDAHIKTVWANSIFFPIVELFSATSIALLIWYGVKGGVEGSITFGNIFTFILLIHMLFRPIRQLADKFNTLQMGMVGSERVFRLLDTHAHIEDNGTMDFKQVNGDIAFKDVHFGYNETDPVLKNINLNIKSGETVAFVGSTGAGKTSIINLLSRFYEYQSGEIYIDNINIKEIPLEKLRSQIAVVLQDVFLFSDTVLNNITLNNSEITREQVINAAKIVGAHKFIMRLPNNYDYQVGERGGVLSVGQRQLLAFIRAYVYNPKILILDEATSSVDTESEILIQKAIDKITQNRTSIVIAHRLSTIQKANNIIVMDKGEIVEQGNHQELLSLKGIYHRLFLLQFS